MEFDGIMKADEYGEWGMGEFGKEVAETCLYTSEFGYDGGDPEVRLPAEYMREVDWSNML